MKKIDPKEIISKAKGCLVKFSEFVKKNLLVFILVPIVLILLYIFIAERGRRKGLEGRLEDATKDIVRLENEIRKSEKDFIDLKKQLKQNEEEFYNNPVDNNISVDSLLNKMSDRFKSDGVSYIPHDRQR